MSRRREEKESVNLFRFLHPQSLDTPEEIARYIEERKKRFPTRRNVELKRKEEQERRKRGEIVVRDSRARLIMSVMNQQRHHHHHHHQQQQQLSVRRKHRNLLRGLLEGQIKRERVVMLQLVRHLVNERFYSHVTSVNGQEIEGGGGELEPHIASQLDRIQTLFPRGRERRLDDDGDKSQESGSEQSGDESGGDDAVDSAQEEEG